MRDSFGDRMKEQEGKESDRTLMKGIPIIARLDGINFHSFTKGLERPYDVRLSNLMVCTTEYLVKEFGANCGYTQSDEISLGWYIDNYEQEMYAGGRVLKLVSHLASKCSIWFNEMLRFYIPDTHYWEKTPVFDCRIFNVPNIVEASNQFLWRENDCTRNSISMAAQSQFSHNELHNKSCTEMQEMLFKKGINWNNYPNFFKRGTYVVKHQTARPYTTEELKELNPKHNAHKDPDGLIIRNEYKVYDDLSPLACIPNRARFLFEGERPICI